jgi:hypothetical protein
MKLPNTFPASPAPGQRRDEDVPGLTLRIPIEPQAEVKVQATFVAGETELDGETKYQRPIFWLEAEGTGDARFDFAVCGAILTGDELKLQHGLQERPAPQHPLRLRARVNGRIERGKRIDFELAKTADGGALLSHGGGKSGRQAIAKPPATRIVAINVGLDREADFPKVGDRRDKTLPGAWQPLYGWILEALTVNGKAVLEGGPALPPDDGPDPVDPQDPQDPQEPDTSLQDLRAKLEAIRDLAEEALRELG